MQSLGKLAPLGALYFAQGLPFGVQTTALPLLLRERGASLEAVGFAGLLVLPWLGKALWAPFVDRYGWARFGRRKSWIVPMQLGLAGCALAAAFTEQVGALAALILAMNFFAATQDIAVDALAVSWLQPGQLGPGNALQVIGYKLGMLTGGGLLVYASRWIGWQGLFLAVAALMVVIALWASQLHEPEDSAPLPTREIRLRLWEALRLPGTRALLPIMLTYKTGESMADAMWKPMLLDRGVAAADIGLWAGTWGMICSLIGTSATGVLARTIPLPRLLLWTSMVRALGLLAEWWAAAHADAGSAALIAITCIEHLAGGGITTVVFALMMRHTDREIGATHYTLLASVEVLGKMWLGTLSGVITRAIGYASLYALAAALSVAFIALAAALYRPLTRELA
ncbi:MAG TPA: MFS transporter [Polyangiales bacterium]|nr:MFS transporter [Polyangiales bacterium]